MKKVSLNIATSKTQKLIGLLSDLENVDRQRMSSSGKHYLDEIWKLLGLPTYKEVEAMNLKETTDQDFPFKPHPIPNTEEE